MILQYFGILLRRTNLVNWWAALFHRISDSGLPFGGYIIGFVPIYGIYVTIECIQRSDLGQRHRSKSAGRHCWVNFFYSQVLLETVLTWSIFIFSGTSRIWSFLRLAHKCYHWFRIGSGFCYYWHQSEPFGCSGAQLYSHGWAGKTSHLTKETRRNRRN